MTRLASGSNQLPRAGRGASNPLWRKIIPVWEFADRILSATDNVVSWVLSSTVPKFKRRLHPNYYH